VGGATNSPQHSQGAFIWIPSQFVQLSSSTTILAQNSLGHVGIWVTSLDKARQMDSTPIERAIARTMLGKEALSIVQRECQTR